MGPRAKRVLLTALNFLNGLGKVCLGDLRCGSGISLCTNDARQRDHDDTPHRDAANRGKNRQSTASPLEAMITFPPPVSAAPRQRRAGSEKGFYRCWNLDARGRRCKTSAGQDAALTCAPDAKMATAHTNPQTETAWMLDIKNHQGVSCLG